MHSEAVVCVLAAVLVLACCSPVLGSENGSKWIAVGRKMPSNGEKFAHTSQTRSNAGRERHLVEQNRPDWHKHAKEAGRSLYREALPKIERIVWGWLHAHGVPLAPDAANRVDHQLGLAPEQQGSTLQLVAEPWTLSGARRIDKDRAREQAVVHRTHIGTTLTGRAGEMLVRVVLQFESYARDHTGALEATITRRGSPGVRILDDHGRPLILTLDPGHYNDGKTTPAQMLANEVGTKKLHLAHPTGDAQQVELANEITTKAQFNIHLACLFDVLALQTSYLKPLETISAALINPR